ncbi:9121_t:CDS:2, partial [Racocetra persica]
NLKAVESELKKLHQWATSVASKQEFFLAGLTISKTQIHLLPETARA